MSEAAEPSKPTRGRRAGPAELRRRGFLAASLCLLVLGTWQAAVQPPGPDRLHSPAPFVSAEWWTTPIEQNALHQLPAVRGELASVCAVPDSGEVWACGTDGLILRSRDSGRSWDRVPLPSGVPRRDARKPASAKYLDPAPQAQLPPAEKGSPSPTLEPVKNPEETPAPKKTEDPQDSQLPHLYVVRFVSRKTGWIAGQDAVLLATQDGGDTWQLRKPPLTGELRSIDFLTPTQGWIAGQRGVLTTVDGGVSWTPLDSAPRGECSMVRLASPQRAWLLVRSTLHLTNDAGKTWTPLEGSLPENFHSVSGPDRSDFWFGHEGSLRSAQGLAPRDEKKGSGGSRSSWGSEILSCASLGRSEYVTVGAGGLILKSVEGGKPWKRSASGSSGTLYDVAFAGRNLGWAVGSRGTILGTRDGGATWYPLSRPRERSVSFEEQRLSFEIRDGVLRKEGPTGSRSVPIGDEPVKAESLYFDGPDHGLVWTDDRRIFETRDGGGTWSELGAHRPWFAPWYVFLLFPVAGLFLLGRRNPPPAAVLEASVADLAMSDRPLEEGDPDPLNFGGLARGLSRFLRNENTQPPLTVAVTGAWGTGKSSLMNLLRSDLRRNGLRPVWFNAWHHQEEENLLAALLQSVRLEATPPLFDPAGLGFRLRLWALRLTKYWRRSLLFGALLLLSLVYLARHPHEIGGYLKSILEPVSAHEGESVLTALLLQVLGPWLGVFGGTSFFLKAFRAFGVNPADLLASQTGNTKTSALEAQTSFRLHFAREFNEVATALRPRTLTLFIDDLDRCSPENVLKILEAVNFLVSSGPCVVVMGLDLQYVRSAVKGILEAQIGKQFADRYLEKLVNLEVAVPTPTAEQMDRFLLASLERERERAEDLETHAWAVTEKLRSVWTLAGGLGLFAAAWWVGSLLPAPTVPPATEPESPRVITRWTDPPEREISTTAEARPADRSLGFADLELVSGFEAAGPTSNPYGLLLLAAVAIGAAAAIAGSFQLKGEVVVKDSPEFKAALRTWNPVLILDPLDPARRSTPRAVKRVMNRIRYLAMLQRPAPPIPTPVVRLLRLLGRSGFPAATSAAASPVLAESTLVSLGVLQYLKAEWIDAPPPYEEFRKTIEARMGADLPAFVAAVDEQRWKETVAGLPLYRALGTGFRLG